MAKIPPAISSRMPAVNSRRADNCSILGIPFCAKIVLHPVDVPGTNCNVPQGLSHCSGRHWCIQRHQKQCRPHLVGNIVFRHNVSILINLDMVDQLNEKFPGKLVDILMFCKGHQCGMLTLYSVCQFRSFSVQPGQHIRKSDNLSFII